MRLGSLGLTRTGANHVRVSSSHLSPLRAPLIIRLDVQLALSSAMLQASHLASGSVGLELLREFPLSLSKRLEMWNLPRKS